MASIKICSYNHNVRGINGDTKRRDVLEYLKQMNKNIYCIQDIHCGEQQTNKFKRDWEGEMIICSGTSNSRGVAILLSKNFEYNIIETKSDPNGNYIALKIRMLQTEVSLINIYGPNVDDSNFYIPIINALEQFQCATIIMCGDWNTVQNQTLDTKHYVRENNTRCREKVSTIREEFELVDPWRNNNPNKKQYTWFQRNPVKMARLDYFLVSSDIMALTSKIEMKPGYRSDHSIVILNITITEEARGKGFWKFNTSLLHDIKYVILIKEVIRENIQRYAKPEQDLDNQKVQFNINDQLFFETLKMEIRKSTIYYSSKKKRELEKEEKTLREQIENIMNVSNVTGEKLEEVKILEDKLEEIRCNKIKGMVLRSKVQWIEESEKPTKFFASLEKRNYVNKLINKLDIHGNIVQNPQTILNETEHFYENLYQTKINPKEQTDYINMFLNEHNIHKLNNEQKVSCEGNITVEEIKAVLGDMKPDKTPGIDGIPVEFYKVFWKDIGHFLVRSIQSAYRSGELSITQKRGIITCIPKGDKPREFLKNWRPITLLTADYKIITSVLAKRMKTVLNNIIGPDQRGFLKDRYIEDNTRLIYDLVQYCKDNRMDGLLLLIDFEKAFDSIEWSYITEILNRYNFGKDIIKWFNIVYKDAQSCVINNGKYSKFFTLGRGCRQGDPWSPYIFILSIEPLAQYIKQHGHITGITFGNKQVKIGQYADDTFLVLDGSEQSISKSIETFKHFKKVSGLSINVDKTQIVKLGQLNRYTKCPFLKIPYSTHFKILGINFSLNLDEINDLNYKKKIADIQKLVRVYQGRNLSLAGRITIIKMYMLPKFVHVLAVLPSPNQQYIKEINTILVNFVWNNKRPKIQLNTLAQEYQDGGQKMLHFDSFCKAAKLVWIKKLYVTDENHSWKTVALRILMEQNIPCIFEGSIPNIKLNAHKTNNHFWKEVLQSWAFYRENIEKKDQEELMPYTVIWSSGLIRNSNLKLFYVQGTSLSERSI